jgi:hypothetical protein
MKQSVVQTVFLLPEFSSSIETLPEIRVHRWRLRGPLVLRQPAALLNLE